MEYFIQLLTDREMNIVENSSHSDEEGALLPTATKRHKKERKPRRSYSLEGSVKMLVASQKNRPQEIAEYTNSFKVCKV